MLKANFFVCLLFFLVALFSTWGICKILSKSIKASKVFEKFAKSLKRLQAVYLSATLILLLAAFFVTIPFTKILLLQIFILLLHIAFSFLSFWAFKRFTQEK